MPRNPYTTEIPKDMNELFLALESYCDPRTRTRVELRRVMLALDDLIEARVKAGIEVKAARLRMTRARQR